MSREQPDHSEQRDIALARALAEALKQRQAAAASATASGEACPEAELVAAYAEHALDEHETTRLENHFAECSRCRTVLAVLTASADEPLAAQEVRQLGELVAAATLPAAENVRAEKQTRAPSWFPAFRWPWLIPVGIAAATALFFISRPAHFGQPRPASTELAVKTTGSSQAEDAQTNRQSNQIAEAYVPAEPVPGAQIKAPNGQAATSLRDLQTGSVREEADATKEKKAATALSESSPAPSPVAPAPPESATAGAAASDRTLQAGAAPVNGPAVDAVSPSIAAPRAFAPAAQAKSAAPAASAEPSANAPPARKAPEFRGQIQALSALQAANSFTSPDGKVSWRVGAAGRIERSGDQGRSWQPQVSGVTSDLVAGVATSGQVAWVVGRAGVILRTTDGAHWQRVASPEAGLLENAGNVNAAAKSTLDWTRVEASDAFHATVVSGDLQRFHTEDGGQSWTRQP